MPFAALLVLIVIAFILFAATIEEPPITFVFFLVFAGLLIWLFIGITAPSRLDKELEISIVHDKSTGAQVASFREPDGQYTVLNLNIMFKRVIEEGSKLKVVLYQDGPYRGIYFWPGRQYVLVNKENVILETQ